MKSETKNRLSRLLLPVLLLGALAALPATAAADERPCRGKMGSKTVEDLRVPQGATCVLTGTKVEGNIEVKRNAVLRARGVQVDGNVHGENARQFHVVWSSHIERDVQVFSGVASEVRDSVIGGNIQFDENRGALRVVNNTVDGDVQLFENQSSAVKKVLGNRIEGNKEDQCSRL